MIERVVIHEVADTNEDMVEQFVVPYTSNPLVVDAFLKVDRRRFVPEEAHDYSYHRIAITLVRGRSTISMPSMQAILMEHMELTGKGRMLEIGTASAHGAALISACASEVVTIEHDPILARAAEERLAREGFSDKVQVVVGDGALGFEERAPYDRIVVTAGCRQLPMALIDQLAEDGIIVAPVNPASSVEQRLIAGQKVSGHVYERVVHDRVTFVPLLSPEHGGWIEEDVIFHEQREEEEYVAETRNNSVFLIDQIEPGFYDR